MRNRSTTRPRPKDDDEGPAPRDVLRTFLEFRSVVLRDPMRQTITFLHGHNLSIAAIASLMELGRRGDQSVSQLATDIGLSVAATSQLIERLVQEKLVTRTESAVDRRRKQLALTTAGRRLLNKMEGAYTAAAEKVFAGVPAHALRDLDAALAAVIACTPPRE